MRPYLPPDCGKGAAPSAGFPEVTVAPLTCPLAIQCALQGPAENTPLLQGLRLSSVSTADEA